MLDGWCERRGEKVGKEIHGFSTRSCFVLLLFNGKSRGREVDKCIGFLFSIPDPREAFSHDARCDVVVGFGLKSSTLLGESLSSTAVYKMHAPLQHCCTSEQIHFPIPIVTVARCCHLQNIQYDCLPHW